MLQTVIQINIKIYMSDTIIYEAAKTIGNTINKYERKETKGVSGIAL